MATSDERIELVRASVREHEYGRGLSRPQAIDATAKYLGLNASTVRRYLREGNRRDVHGAVVIEPHYTLYQDKVDVTKDYTIVAIGDVHDDPRLPDDRFEWLGRFVSDVKPDGVIQIGDIATFDSLCRYDGNDTYKGKQKPLFVEDIVSLDHALGRFNKGLGKTPLDIKHITLGNHEDRVESFSDRHPEIYGLMAREFYGVLERHGWTYSPFGKMIKIGGVGFVHVPLNEMGKPYGGKTAEQRIANDATHDVVLGHSHRNRVITQAKVGDNKFVRIINLGSALPQGHVERYARHSATGWSYGAYVLDIRGQHIVNWGYIDMATLEEEYHD